MIELPVITSFVHFKRAERRKQRRQTFHGFSGQDENTESVINQNISSILPCGQAFNSTDVIKTGCLSAHKEGLGKNVTFKETFDKEMCPGNIKWNKSTSSCKTDANSRSCKKQASKESFKSQSKSGSNGEIMQFECESDGKNVDSLKKKAVKLTNDSLVLQGDERIIDDGATVKENLVAYCYETHEPEALLSRNGVAEDLSDLSKGKEGTFALANKDMCNVERGSCAKEVDDLSNKTANKSRINRNSQDTENVNLPEVTCTLNEKGKGFPEREPDNVSMLTNNVSDSSSFGNCHWLKLFEEEFPRRSLRLQSTPNFQCRDDTCDISHVPQGSKTKPPKTKQLRGGKERQKKKIKATLNVKNLSVLDGTQRKRTVDDFIFPKPGLELTKPSGPLGIVVDFSLPDKEFVKLKLAKIKSALLAERKKNNVSERKEMALTPAHESGKICKLTDEKSANKEENSNIYELKEQYQAVENVSELPSANHKQWSISNKQNSVPEIQDSFVSSADMVGSDDGIKSKDIDMVSSANAAEKVKTTMINVMPMMATCVEYPRQSFLLQNTTNNDTCVKAHSSPKQKLSEGDSTKKIIMPCQAVSDDKYLQSVLKTDDYESANRISFENERLKECNKEDKAGNNEALTVNMCLQKTTTSDNVDEEFLNQRESAVGLNFSFNSGAQTASRNICEEELHRFSTNALSSLTNNTDSRLGDRVTCGKMSEPLESSQVSYKCMASAGEPTDGAPVDMTVCLQV